MKISPLLTLTLAVSAAAPLLTACGEEPSTEPAVERPAAPAAEQPSNSPGKSTQPAETPREETDEPEEESENDELDDEEALQLPETPTPSPHAVFDHWQAVFAEQSQPAMLFGREPDKTYEPSAEELEELAEVQQHIAAALEAGKALYKARMGIVKGALEVPDFYMEDDELEEFISTCEAYIAEGFRRDLEALSFCFSWLDAGCVAPGMRPGRQELLFRPELETLRFERIEGGTPDICCGIAAVNSEWMERQDSFMQRFFSLYGDGEYAPDDAGRAEPFTHMSWEFGQDGKPTAETQAFRANMQTLIREERKAWKRYLKEMLDLVCPCRGYRGSGIGIFMSTYESHLLDSRERFLCLLTVGAQGLRQLSHLTTERQAELLELHPEHAYGEIFTSYAQLFRHPKLEGQPWCIRFDDCGAGFIFVAGGEALQRYANEHPEGGEVEVRGYQSIEQTGEPYEMQENEEDETSRRHQARQRPDNALKLRQVFHLQSYTARGEEPPEPDA